MTSFEASYFFYNNKIEELTLLKKLILSIGLFLFVTNTAIANQMTFECECNERQLIQSLTRNEIENSSVILRFMIKYNPETNIGKVYYVTGEPHSIFKQCQLDDKRILITYHNEDEDAKGSYSGELTINRYTGDIFGNMLHQSYAKNGYGMNMWRFKSYYNGTCKPYTVTKKF